MNFGILRFVVDWDLIVRMRAGTVAGAAEKADRPVDAPPSFIYKPPMICAFPRPMATTHSLGFAGGPEGMRVR
jgi:hypothetical protein